MKKYQKKSVSEGKNDAGKANLSRSENHCHPQNGQINPSQE